MNDPSSLGFRVNHGLTLEMLLSQRVLLGLSVEGKLCLPCQASHLQEVLVISGFRQMDDSVILSCFCELNDILNCNCPEIASFVIHNSLAYYKRVGLGQPASRWRCRSVGQATLR